jgi:hypothetical protein
MKYLIMIYPDPAKLEAMPEGEFKSTMRACLAHADELRKRGMILDSQMLQPASTARSLRKKDGRDVVTDGPFAETKEVLAGYNIVEAASMDEAVKIAGEFPWTDIGAIEVRPILELSDMRERVKA